MDEGRKRTLNLILLCDNLFQSAGVMKKAVICACLYIVADVRSDIPGHFLEILYRAKSRVVSYGGKFSKGKPK